MNNFIEALKLLDPIVKTKLQFWLYYDKETGAPLVYTMKKQDEGDFIRINKDEFAECRYDIVVKGGKITRPKNSVIGKLVPSEEGFGTIREDVSIVGTEQYWSVKTYD